MPKRTRKFRNHTKVCPVLLQRQRETKVSISERYLRTVQLSEQHFLRQKTLNHKFPELLDDLPPLSAIKWEDFTECLPGSKRSSFAEHYHNLHRPVCPATSAKTVRIEKFESKFCGWSNFGEVTSRFWSNKTRGFADQISRQEHPATEVSEMISVRHHKPGAFVDCAAVCARNSLVRLPVATLRIKALDVSSHVCWCLWRFVERCTNCQ